MLPAGNGTFTNNCGTTTNIPTGNNGRFKNTLIGQTIALGFNMRLDTSLANVVISGTTLVTQATNAGSDGLCGSSDDTPVDGSTSVHYIPQSVIDALNSIYGSATIANLFDLANRALGGLSTGGASLSDIVAAEGAINEGFDECRFLVGFSGNNSRMGSVSNDPAEEGSENVIRAYPNPFSDATTFEFSVAEEGKATLEVYNTAGAKVAALFESIAETGIVYKVNFDAENLLGGIYVYKLSTASKTITHHLAIVR